MVIPFVKYWHNFKNQFLALFPIIGVLEVLIMGNNLLPFAVLICARRALVSWKNRSRSCLIWFLKYSSLVLEDVDWAICSKFPCRNPFRNDTRKSKSLSRRLRVCNFFPIALSSKGRNVSLSLALRSGKILKNRSSTTNEVAASAKNRNSSWCSPLTPARLYL